MIGILLYHGTIDRYAYSIVKNGIDLEKSKDHLDFGRGFYTTPNKDFAITTAKTRQKKYNLFHPDDHVGWRVVEIECDTDSAAALNCKEFHAADDEWGKFIIANRCSNDQVHAEYDNNLAKDYDIVTGATADGSKNTITALVESVNAGECSFDDIDFSSIAPSESDGWSDQVSFHTSKALKTITIKGIMKNPYLQEVES